LIEVSASFEMIQCALTGQQNKATIIYFGSHQLGFWCSFNEAICQLCQS